MLITSSRTTGGGQRSSNSSSIELLTNPGCRNDQPTNTADPVECLTLTAYRELVLFAGTLRSISAEVDYVRSPGEKVSWEFQANGPAVTLGLKVSNSKRFILIESMNRCLITRIAVF